tara:strand:- start:84 stop:674 length:591 start_codon:yes stop_codon:yes gene_type:complete
MKFLFDLGGVFFDWDPSFFYKSVFKSSKDMNYFLENVCNQEWNLKQDAGRKIKDAEEELIKKFPNYSDKILMYYSNHRKMIKGTFHQSINEFLKLKSLNYECFVLSNWSAETFLGMDDEYEFLKKFDGILISGNEKLIKPNKLFFKIAIKRFNLTPNETVFIDDNFKNITAGEELGFKTIYLQNPNTISKDIRKYL